MSLPIIIIGAGVFGVTAAYELSLRRPGTKIILIDAYSYPNPRSASNDENKLVRGDYGKDSFFCKLGLKSIDGWKKWNSLFYREFGCNVYEQTGILFLSKNKMLRGGFEGDSYAALRQNGEKLERLNPKGSKFEKFWNLEDYKDGYFNPNAGYCKSGLLVDILLNKCIQNGVMFLENDKVVKIKNRSFCVSLKTSSGKYINGSSVIIAAGSWSSELIKSNFNIDIEKILYPTQQTLLWLKVPDKSWCSSYFPGFVADIENTGFYGFPPVYNEKTQNWEIKIGHHGKGKCLNPNDPTAFEPNNDKTRQETIKKFQEFYSKKWKKWKELTPLNYRHCFYSDTINGDFIIDRLSDRIVVATGGSGHAMKFAPILGEIIIDTLDNSVIDKEIKKRFSISEKFVPTLKRTKEDARALL